MDGEPVPGIEAHTPRQALGPLGTTQAFSGGNFSSLRTVSNPSLRPSRPQIIGYRLRRRSAQKWWYHADKKVELKLGATPWRRGHALWRPLQPLHPRKRLIIINTRGVKYLRGSGAAGAPTYTVSL